MKQLFQRIACPWVVTAVWGDLTATHRSTTFSDAADWARQYPAGSVVVIRHRWAGVRAARTA
jgi:hypothetical protein